MITKAERVRQLLRAGRDLEALRLVARLPKLPEPEKTDVKRAVACLLSPSFYESMNYNIDVCVRRGIDAVRRLFGTD